MRRARRAGWSVAAGGMVAGVLLLAVGVQTGRSNDVTADTCLESCRSVRDDIAAECQRRHACLKPALTDRQDAITTAEETRTEAFDACAEAGPFRGGDAAGVGGCTTTLLECTEQARADFNKAQNAANAKYKRALRATCRTTDGNIDRNALRCPDDLRRHLKACQQACQVRLAASARSAAASTPAARGRATTACEQACGDARGCHDDCEDQCNDDADAEALCKQHCRDKNCDSLADCECPTVKGACTQLETTTTVRTTTTTSVTGTTSDGSTTTSTTTTTTTLI